MEPHRPQFKYRSVHPQDLIISDRRRGTQTRSSVAKDEVLMEANWITAMQEELQEFERSKVWLLVPRPNRTVIGIR